MRTILMALCLVVFGVAAKADDLATIKNISGCFNVGYRFVEDGANDTTIVGDFYEWISQQNIDDGVFMPHYGQEKGDDGKMQAQKHWSESWTAGNNGTWTQIVKGPAGDMRYICAGKFVFNQFHCFVKDAPKPRRDSNRTDYVTLDRDITLQITPKGWIQVEKNTKKDATGKAISNEVGWNQYDRVSDDKCAVAIQTEKDDNSGK